MLAFFFNFLFLLASETPAGGQTLWQQFLLFWDQVLQFWHTYLDYPGFEAWKFMNLGIFILALYLLLRRPLSAAFKAKRESIRAELIKAQEERDAAMKKLQEVEGRLAMLDTEVAGVEEKAAADAETEKARIATQTESDIAKMREQAQNEIARAGQQAKAELRRFSAEESIRLAEEMLRQQVSSDTDSKLVKTGIDKLAGINTGGLN